MSPFSKALVFTAFVYLGLSACGLMRPQGPKTAHVVSELPGEAHDILRKTINDIELGSDERFLSNHRAPFTITIAYAEKMEDTVLGEAWGDKKTWCEIRLNPKLDPILYRFVYSKEDIQSVIAHEIGHCFGMKHHEDPTHVMYWAYDRRQKSAESFAVFVDDLKRIRGMK